MRCTIPGEFKPNPGLNKAQISQVVLYHLNFKSHLGVRLFADNRGRVSVEHGWTNTAASTTHDGNSPQFDF